MRRRLTIGGVAATTFAFSAAIALGHASETDEAASAADDEPLEVLEAQDAFELAQLQRRPGPAPPAPAPAPPVDPTRVTPPSPSAFPGDFLPVPDRWRIVESLGVNERLYDPYSQNTLKGDRPIFGTDDWFINLSAISDTVVEPRSIPTPVAIQTGDPGSNSVFGGDDQLFASQTIIASASVIKGDTAFKPQDLEFRITAAYQYNYLDVEEKRIVDADPDQGTERNDDFLGLQEAFVDYHIRNVSDRYDFDSIRVGIQPFTADFRGFLYQENPIGVRIFGTRQNNLWQYNLAAFQRIEKDINSGLNDVGESLRNDYVFVANLYRQDFPYLGLTSQGTVIYNRNRDDDFVDKNGFPERPAEFALGERRNYDIVYLGYNLDGHYKRLNLTASAYYALGDNKSPFTGSTNKVRAYFAAVEPSVDFDWVRVRLSALYASGDDDPYDNEDEGFDAILENPLFAGADTSYWIRQSVPFIGGGFVGLNGRNGVLASLRSSKDQGQANYTNPGIKLLGGGADFDILPSLRLSLNANYLWFNDTTVLQESRQQAEISEEIGWDLSAATIWRPFVNQNIVLRLSGATLLPGEGFKDLYGDDEDYYYSILGNLILAY